MKQFILAALMLAVCATAWGTVPGTISYQGVFRDAEGNVMPDGTYFIGFHIFAAAVGGPPVWSEWQEVDVVDGMFNVILGAFTPLTPTLFPKGGAWFSMSYDEEFLLPRQPFTSVPYAFRSCVTAHSDSLGDLTESSINSTFSSHQSQITTVNTRVDSVVSVLGNGGDDCCCEMRIVRMSSSGFFDVPAGDILWLNSGNFELSNATSIHFYATTGLPDDDYPTPFPKITMKVWLYNSNDQPVHGSWPVGGFAPVSYNVETVDNSVAAGFYYMRISLVNDGDDDVSFRGWEMGAVYEYCENITPTDPNSE